MEIIDSHAHLEFPQFDEDRAAMLGRARAAGIETLLAIGSGTGPERLNAAIPFAEEYDWIYATIGIHPHEAQLATEEHFARLDELAKHPRVIAWGEMGLDYYYDHSPREVQQQVFRRQLGQAREAKLPIVIHCRDAWDDCLATDGAGLEADGAWRDSALLYRDACGCAARAGHGIHDFVCGERDVSEDAAFARRGARAADGAFADGNGFAVFAAAGKARKKKRAGQRRGGSASVGECEKLNGRRNRGHDGCKFQKVFRA